MIFSHHDLRMAYDDCGDGFPVLFIHGHPFNRSMWARQIHSLRWRYRTIAPDLRGYGDSEHGTNHAFTQEEFAADLGCLLDHLSIGKAAVVGLSMGGQIAMEFARAFPNRTAALILAATFPQAETEAGITDRNRSADRIINEGIAPIAAELLCKLIGAETLRNRPDIARHVFEMMCGVSPSGAAAAVRGRALRKDYRPSLAEFQGPVKIIVGTEDRFTSVAEARDMHLIVKNGSLDIYERIGHMPNLEDEDRFNRSLHTFLQHIAPKSDR